MAVGISRCGLQKCTDMAQSVISAYESGHRQPALPTLTALVDAAGFDLDVRVRRRRRGQKVAVERSHDHRRRAAPGTRPSRSAAGRVG
jgi:predicted transcriptional regulator